ncbi:MAG: ABC transporter substrate-binding protein [bacterium]
MGSEERLDINRVFRIISFRSLIYISLLVFLLALIKIYLDNQPKPKGSNPQGVSRTYRLAMVNNSPEFKRHITGFQSGMTSLWNSINYVLYNSLDEVKDEDILYVLGRDNVRLALQKFPDRKIIGYAGFQEKPSRNYTGVFSGPDWIECLNVYREFLPGIRRIGVLYTPGDPDLEDQVEALQKLAEGDPDLEITILSVPQNDGDLPGKLDSLSGENIDTFLALCQDKNIQQALPVISEYCLKNRIFLVGGGKAGAREGALISVDFDQERVGREATRIIAQIVKDNKNPDQIPITFPQPDIFINVASFYKLNLQVPPALRKKAKEVFP